MSVPAQPGALPRDQQKALLEKVQKAIEGSSTKFYDWKRLRNDAIDLMNTHVNLQPSLGALKEKPGVSFVKLEGNVQMLYQGIGYWVPLAICFPADYPVNYPTIEVRPVGDLIINPNHERVDVLGKVYLNYLHGWNKSCKALDAITELCGYFQDKPFIYKRPPQATQQAPRQPSHQPAYHQPTHQPTHHQPSRPHQSGGTPPPPPYQEPPPPAYESPPHSPTRAMTSLSIQDPSASVNGEAVSKLVESFQCPISMEIMVDPVFAADGHSYERVFIEEWLQTKTTSPLTNQPLAHKHLVPNHNLRSQILEYQNSTASRTPIGLA